LKLISTEVPNVAMGFFPYTFIPGFLAPLAVTLHVLAIRAIATRDRLPSELVGKDENAETTA
jgi:hypothetical protein